MGSEQDFGDGKGASADTLRGPRHSVRAAFHQPPEQFEGCFTTFYQLELDVADGGVVEDYLQPEWANLRFFGGSRPKSKIGDHSLTDARFVATGPSSLACQFSVAVRVCGALAYCRSVGLG
jgi:hypothetical protein